MRRSPLRSAPMADAGRSGGALDGTPALEWGVVGFTDPVTGSPEPSPTYVECVNGQWLVEVTLVGDDEQEIVARIGTNGAGAGFGDSFDLGYGDRVVVARVSDSDGGYVVIACVHDAAARVPDSVCGVATGAAAAVPGNETPVPGPRWRFVRLREGALLAIETQAGGDVLIHSGASVELRAGVGAIHLNGATHLGVGPTTPPVGAMVGPAGTTIPGTPAVPHVPLPRAASIPAPPAAIVPYAGLQNGIVRASDGTQSHIATDPYYWAYMTLLHSFPLILAWQTAGGFPAPPVVLHSEHSGLQGPGSQHTANG